MYIPHYASENVTFSGNSGPSEELNSLVTHFLPVMFTFNKTSCISCAALKTVRRRRYYLYDICICHRDMSDDKKIEGIRYLSMVYWYIKGVSA